MVLVNIDKDDEHRVRMMIKNIVPVDNRSAYEPVEDTYEIVVHSKKGIRVEHNKAIIPKFDLDYIKIFSLVLAESVAIEAFENSTQQILIQSTGYSRELKRTGKYSASKAELLKFIGFVMTTRQDILSNLYISDSPDETWDDFMLEKIFNKMMNMFDIEPRFRSLNLSLNSIQASVEIMVDLLNTKRAHFMELCIIGLIAFEIVWAFAEKIFKF